MSYYVLTHPYSFPSARLLRDEIQKVIGSRVLITSRPERVKGTLLVRYGASDPVGRGVVDTQFNTPEFIGLASNKASFSWQAKQHHIWTPEFSRGAAPLSTDYPVMIRTTLTSSGGRGIIICNTAEDFNREWRSGYYWTPFIRTSSEYRVHVLGGQIAKVFKKVRNPGLAEEDTPVRNLHRGYHFSLIQQVEGMARLNELVANLSTFITGKFYALDCAYSRTEHNYVVWEINSAPGLNEDTSSRYARFIVDSIFPGRFSNDSRSTTDQRGT